MNGFTWILILLELCLLIPLAGLKGRENRCSSYTKERILHVEKQRRRKLFRKYACYIPTVSYQIKGIPYEMKYTGTDNDDEFQTGDDFWVMYNTNDPHEIYQEDHFALFKARFIAFIGIWLAIITLFCAIL